MESDKIAGVIERFLAQRFDETLGEPQTIKFDACDRPQLVLDLAQEIAEHAT